MEEECWERAKRFRAGQNWKAKRAFAAIGQIHIDFKNAISRMQALMLDPFLWFSIDKLKSQIAVCDPYITTDK